MPIEQRGDVQPGTADDHRQPAPIRDRRDQRARALDPLGNGERLVGIGQIEQVVRDRCTGRGIGLGGTDVHAAVDLPGVGHQDLDRQALGEGQSQVRLAGCCRPDHADQR